MKKPPRARWLFKHSVWFQFSCVLHSLFREHSHDIVQDFNGPTSH